jgi:hypothetical protein
MGITVLHGRWASRWACHSEGCMKQLRHLLRDNMNCHQVHFVLLFRLVMNSKMLWLCQKQIMGGHNYVFRIINPLKIIIMMFIRYVLNYGFAKKSLPIKIRLRRLSLLCFNQIWSWNTNIVPGITHTTHNLSIISFRKKSIMISLWEIITNVLLVRPLRRRSITVQRVTKRWMVKTTIKRSLINFRNASEIIRTRRANPKTKVQEKTRNFSSATAVVVLIILQRSAIYPNTWLTCTKNPWRIPGKLKDDMKLTSMLHPMRLQV